MATYRARLEQLLAERADAYGVPGAVAGVLLDDELILVAWGVANVSTGVEVTTDTLFQIGSITKIYTATLLSQVAGAGVVSLDEPVRAQLQEFAVADPGATLEITPRHLLAHTSGMHGDHLIDTGWNSDALERYVAGLHALGQIHAPDETYSFCNTGFGVAGRLIEVATGEHFDRVLRRRLARPIGVRSTLTLPQHALMHRVAVGHELGPDGTLRPIPRWPLARSNGPMGGILAPAEDVLAFARLHLAGGVAANGTELLPASMVKAMAQPQIESPLPDEDQALAWTVRRWNGVTCLAQDGDTFGQRAYLRVVPERRFAAVLFTNSPGGARLAHDFWPQLVGDLLEVTVPPTAEMGDPVPIDDPAPFVGTYERLHQTVEVTEAEFGSLEMIINPSGVLQQLGREDARIELVPMDVEGGVFRATLPETGVDEAVVFTPLGDDFSDLNPADALYLQGRLHRRE
ncbi:MAG TPA: serine hydrolase domain-containing protein [Acidimicrobiales bacterium]|nr:serine hydrolase domain-containing protein [Acidimicrobiales bacterium]